PWHAGESRPTAPTVMTAAVCRDCCALLDGTRPTCDRCGGGRLVVHAEIGDLGIAHIDCDAFYASVEKRDRPELAGKPLIIGHAGGRGVVLTACYVARKFGARSAMPMFQALELCPHATVIAPDMGKYKRVSHEIRTIFASATSLIEPLSLDEAYLDLTQRGGGAPPAAVALADIARRVEREIGITVSIGLSCNKFLAKLASELEKPRGFSVIGRGEARAFLAPLSVRRIHGVGAVTARRMEAGGLATIADLQALSEQQLVARFGRFGRRLALFANGDDDRKVTPDRPVKSISAETTFARDTGSAGAWRGSSTARGSPGAAWFSSSRPRTSASSPAPAASPIRPGVPPFCSRASAGSSTARPTGARSGSSASAWAGSVRPLAPTLTTSSATPAAARLPGCSTEERMPDGHVRRCGVLPELGYKRRVALWRSPTAAQGSRMVRRPITALLVWTWLAMPAVMPAAAQSDAVALRSREAAAALVRGNVDQAIALYTEALEDKSLPNDRRATILNDRGVAYARRQQQREAIEDFNRAIQLYPEYAALYNNRGNVLLALGAVKEAAKDFDRALLLAPGYAGAYMKQGQIDRAIAAYTKAIKLTPNSAAALSGRGRAQLAANRPHGAIRDFTRAVSLDARFSAAYRSRAEAKMAIGRFEEAVEDFSRAVAFEPRNAEIYALRGQAYVEAGNAASGIKDYAKAIELAPNVGAYYAARGLAYAKAEAYEDALNDFARAIELEPRSPKPYAYRAWTYRQQQQPELGLKDVERALKLDDKSAEAYWAR